MKFSNGSVFGNRYTLGDRIAVGGMGEVWKATDQVLGRVVAIKLLSPSLADQPGFTARFREEARNTASLAHANIAAVYDYGEDDGASWLVMELVEGRPLSQIIKEDGALPPRQVSQIMGQAASALQAAHDAGVVHRDVKPANILVRRDGQVKLTDFGIARAVDAAPITRTGEVMGTAQYISPEQAMGRKVGPQSDIYALGVVAHEMLTGQRPFDEGSPVATAMAHIHNAPPPLPSSVPEPLAGVVMASLRKDPEERPQSAAEVASALAGGPEAERFVGTQVLGSAAPTQAMTRRQAPPPSSPPPATPPGGHRLSDPGEDEPRRSPWLWLAPLLLVLLGLGAFFLAQNGLFGGSPAPNPSSTAPAVSPSQATSEPTTEEPTSQTTAPTSSAPETVQVNPGDYIGRPVGEARAALEALGLQVSINEVENAAPAGRVTAVNPSGARSKGSIVTLTVSRGPAQSSPEPTRAPTTSPAQPSRTATPQEPSQPTGDAGGDGGGAAGSNGGGQGGGDAGGGEATQGSASDLGSKSSQSEGVSSEGMTNAEPAAMGDGRSR